MSVSKPSGVEQPLDLSYEQAQQELETIIERIESGQIGLEQSIAQYERGVALVRHCRRILDRAEQKFTELSVQLEAAPQGAAAGQAGGGGGPGPAGARRRSPLAEAAGNDESGSREPPF